MDSITFLATVAPEEIYGADYQPSTNERAEAAGN